MPAILAKKLGMTQRFLDDGRVERVTVLEAGPCPVTAIRTNDRDGYEAVQLAFGAAKEKHLSKPELGHLKKAGAPPMRHLVEFRDEAGELLVGDTVTVEAFEVGQKVKISGTSKGKGFQGTIKRHNFASGPKSHGSHNVRAPGSIGASAWPARVMKGIRGPGQMGNKRVTNKGLEIATLDDAVFGARFNGPLVHESVRAELAARRQGTHATKTRGNVRGGGAKPWRQKGTGRARAGSSRSPIWTGGGTVFGPSPRHYTPKVNPKEKRAALRSALSLHAERGSLFGLDAAAFDAPSTRQAADLLEDRRGGSVLLLLGSEEGVAAKSFRHL